MCNSALLRNWLIAIGVAIVAATTSVAQSQWSSWAGLGGGITQIATAVNQDGRIEVFAIGTDTALNHIWQTSPGGSWSGWAGLGGGITQIATAVNQDGRIEVFAIGTDKALNHIWQTSPGGSWSGWAGLGGGTTQIAAAVNKDGRIEVFAIGTDTALHHIWQTSPGASWSGWAGLGGGTTQIATAVNQDGRIEVFAIGTDTALHHIWQTSPGGSWSGWAGLGGGTTQIAAAVNKDGRIEVFAIGTDTALHHIWQTSPGGSWSGWSGLGGGTTQIAAAVNQDGRIEVFAIGTDTALHHIWQTSPGGSWSGWAGLSGGITQIAAAVNQDGRIEVFAIGTDKALNHIWQKLLWGFVDLHTHPLANLAFGGKLIYGGMDLGALLPADPDCNLNVRATSEQQALGHDRSTHGAYDLFSNGCGDFTIPVVNKAIRPAVIHRLQSDLGGADQPEDASGYPDFPDWPKWNDLTHQKMWVEWVRRAYSGGLRVMVALATNNKTLGDMTAGSGDYPTDDKSSADLQIREIILFVSRHPDFMEVAFNSADVYRIVSANKLAVVIGIEVDHIGNLQVAIGPMLPDPVPPSDAVVRAEVDRLYAEGVRYIFPIHLIDNAFGGSAAYISLFNVSSARDSGHPYALVCAEPGEDITDSPPQCTVNCGFTYDNSPLDGEVRLLQLVKTKFAVVSLPSPECQAGIGQKNSLALTASGVVAIKEMMRLGMLIDIDHMSQAAADQTLALAMEFSYPVNSGHNGPRGAVAKNHNERALRADQYKTIGLLHGMAGVGSEGLDSRRWLALYNQVIQEMGDSSIVAGFGTDTNGLALGMPPRPGTHPARTELGPQYSQHQACVIEHRKDCPPDSRGKPNVGCMRQWSLACDKEFPNVSITIPASGVQYSNEFPPSREGTKTWDIKSDGVAHFGMLWDFLQDVKLLPGGVDMVDNHFMYGADYFLKTWQIAEIQSATVK